MQKFSKLILFWALIWTTHAFAQSSVPVEQPKSWLIYQSEISKLWKIQNEFLDHHNEIEGNQLFKQILFLKESYDLDQIPPLSTALLRKIPPQTTLNDKIKHPFFLMANELSPNHYTNDYYLCDFYPDPADWFISLRYCFDGLKKELLEPSEQLVFLSKISYQLFWTAFAVILFFVILYILKFSPFTTQYYSSTFYWISPISYLFLMVIFSLLLLFTFGWLFFFAFFYIFFWRFPSLQEKILLFGLACLIMVVPFTFSAPALSKQFHSGVYFDLLNVEKTLQPAKYEERIDKYTMLDSKNPYAHFVLGVMAKKVGNLGEAKRHFDISYNIKSDFPKTKLNLANLKYEFGDSDSAKEEYKRLIASHPNLVSSYINLSQIYTHESNYLSGEEYLNKAKSLNEGNFKNISQKLLRRQGAVKLLYEELDSNDIQDKIYARGEIFRFNFQQFFTNYFPKYSPTVYYGTILITILIALLFQLLTHTRNFYLLYFNREKNLEKLTLIQLREYPQAYQKFAATLENRERLFLIVSTLLPGFGPFMKEKLLKAIAFSFLFSLFVSGYIIETSFPRVHDGLPWKGLNAALASIVFLVNFIDVRTYGQKKN